MNPISPGPRTHADDSSATTDLDVALSATGRPILNDGWTLSLSFNYDIKYRMGQEESEDDE